MWTLPFRVTNEWWIFMSYPRGFTNTSIAETIGFITSPNSWFFWCPDLPTGTSHILLDGQFSRGSDSHQQFVACHQWNDCTSWPWEGCHRWNCRRCFLKISMAIVRICSAGNVLCSDMGMDQYLLIPFLGEWTSIYQLFWCSPGVQGFDALPHARFFLVRVYVLLNCPVW